MHDIIRKCNIIIDLSKFLSNEKKLSEIVTIYYNHVCVYSIKIKDNVKVYIYIYIYRSRIKLYNFEEFFS